MKKSQRKSLYSVGNGVIPWSGPGREENWVYIKIIFYYMLDKIISLEELLVLLKLG